MTTTITGHDAIAHATATGAQLRKHADPIDGARDVTLDEAREIAREDVGLIYCDALDWRTIDLTTGREDIAEGLDPARIRALDEYRRTRSIVGVWVCSTAELDMASDDESADLGPRPEAIDWTGFEEAHAAYARAVAERGVSSVRTAADVEEFAAPEYDGAHITVEATRGTIDPQGIGTDEEFEPAKEHLIGAVRDAFPGADVRVVGNGGRTSGVTRDGTDLTNEVRAVVADAWQSWLATA